MIKRVKKIYSKSTKISRYLVLILIVSILPRFINLNFNTIFIDEAIYINLGKKIISGNIHEGVEAFSWVGGMPFIYPVASAAFYSLGGLIITRAFSAVLGVTSVLLFYFFIKNLNLLAQENNNKFAAFIGALIFATSAIPITISRISNYDGLSFAFFLAGLVFLLKALNSQGKWGFLSAVFFLLSAFTKYITAIYIPFLILFVIIYAIKQKSEKTKITLIKEFCFPLIIGVFGYLLYTYNDLLNFYTSNAVSTSSYITIIEGFIKPSGIIILFSFFGAIYIINRKNYLKIISLFTASLLPVIFHLIGRNQISSTQHSFLTLVFILPFFGALFAVLMQKYNKIIKYIAVFFLISANYLLSMPVIKAQESYWPNSTKSIEVLRSKVKGDDKILAEGDDIYSLYLSDKISDSQVIGPFVFEYKGTTADQAYLTAIDDGYFNYIQLEGTYFSSELINQMKEKIQPKYAPVLTDDPIWVYELNP